LGIPTPWKFRSTILTEAMCRFDGRTTGWTGEFEAGTALGTKPSVFRIIIFTAFTLHYGRHIELRSANLPLVS